MPDLELNKNSEGNIGVKNVHLKGREEYKVLYKASIEDPETFWGKIAGDFYWKSSADNKLSYNFDISKGAISIKWMDKAITNICYNVLDRNVENGLGNKVAFYWEGNDVEDSCVVTYQQLLKQVCKFANVLSGKGIQKGDCVTMYMPMIVELVTAMLACARLGAIHNVVFGGFSAQSLSERLLDSKSSLLVTADGAWRGTKLINLKDIVDEALRLCSEKKHRVNTIVVSHLGQTRNHTVNGYYTHLRAKRPVFDFQVPWNSDTDSWWHEEMATVDSTREPEWVGGEHPLFILYTSGSTGKPKAVLHTTAGYMLYSATTFKYTFAYEPDDVYFCTADIGWITGHSYGVYGPLLQGASSVMFQGIPTHPDPGRYWALVEKYKVSKFYTAPTAIRAMMKYGDSYVQRHNRESLKVLGSVGEPINPEAWQWYHRVVGEKRCTIVDTYWQSETGGHVITPLPGCTAEKPGSATYPFFGVVPAILNDNGNEIEGPGEGHLVFKKPWPGITRTLYGNHHRFETTYFQKFPGYYCTGDGAVRDSDGCYWIMGRIDDMLNVSGHLLSTAEVESALVEHKAVAESAVVGHPHREKGECLYCFIVLKQGISLTKELTFELREKVRSKIGTFATPEYIHYTSALPKTRSGKILRRILRKISRNDRDLGDLSTLADESAIHELFTSRPASAVS